MGFCTMEPFSRQDPRIALKPINVLPTSPIKTFVAATQVTQGLTPVHGGMAAIMCCSFQIAGAGLPMVKSLIALKQDWDNRPANMIPINHDEPVYPDAQIASECNGPFSISRQNLLTTENHAELSLINAQQPVTSGSFTLISKQYPAPN